MCTPCVDQLEICAKCGQKVDEVVNKPEPSEAEAARINAEFQRDIKALPERKRRTFLRYLEKKEKGKKSTGVLNSNVLSCFFCEMHFCKVNLKVARKSVIVQ